MTSSVDGLVSGLSTSSMISQLMTVEAAPQTALKSKVTKALTAVSSYQAVNAKAGALKSAGDALSQLSTWRSIKAASSSSTVTASTSANLNAATGSLTFNVTALASKQSTTMKVSTVQVDTDNDGKLDAGTPLNVPNTITVTKGSYDANGVFTAGSGTPINVDVSKDKSAAGIAKALNAAGAGVSAYVMKTADSEGVLQINSLASGAANGFQITGLDNAGVDGPPASTYASDATLEVVGGGGTKYTVNSSTNTFTNLMAGVTLQVTKKEDNVTVDVSSDTGAIADKFQALVDSANAMLSEIGTQTAYDASTKKGSPLTGDFAVRDMSQRILSQVSTGLSWKTQKANGEDISAKIKSLKELGIELDSTGQLSFDRTRFLNTYAADPARAKEAGMELGDQVEAMATKMTTNLTSVITGRNNEIDGLNDQISNWDVRLAAKREALQKQYSDLEVSLGKLKDQSSWLSGQLAGLS